jgi:hypothetical protein
MTLEQLGNIGEAVGGIAVVVSLLALAIQMRQNTKAVRAESARAAEADWSARNTEFAMHMPIDLALKVHTARGIEGLSPQELLQAQVLLRAIWHQLTSEYYLYRDGVHDKSIWERRLQWCRDYVELPVVSYFFEEERRVLLEPGLYDAVMSKSPSGDVNPASLGPG